MTKLDKLIDYLEKVASQEVTAETDPEFNPFDYSGGSYDDAYEMGVRHGETLMSRGILKHLKEIKETL